MAWPTSAVPDPQGGFYIADFSGQRIRHVSAPVSETQVWNDASVPSGLGPLYGVSSATTSNCVAVGVTTGGNAEVIETTNGGASWSSDTVSSSAPPLLAVSCWAAGACVAVGGGLSPGTGAIYRQTSVNGAFSAVTEPSGDGEIDAVSCPSASYCAAVAYDTTTSRFDDILTSSNAGATWSVALSALTVSGKWASLSALECLSSSTCEAAGAGYYGPTVVNTANGFGAYTGAYYGSAPAYLDSVNCASSSYCLASGLADTLNGPMTGGSWTESANPSPIAQILSDLCISSTTCGIAGDTASATTPANGPGNIETTSNGGSTWTEEAAPAGTGTLFGLTCSPSTPMRPAMSLGRGELCRRGRRQRRRAHRRRRRFEPRPPESVTGSTYTADATGGGSPSEVIARPERPGGNWARPRRHRQR